MPTRLIVKFDSQDYIDLLKLCKMDRRLPMDEICYLIQNEVTRRKVLFALAEAERILYGESMPELDQNEDSTPPQNKDITKDSSAA